MITIAHLLAILFYLAAAALAATPIARPIRAPVRGVHALLACGVLVHAVALVVSGFSDGRLPGFGLGSALSLSALFIAVTLLLVEVIAREVALSLIVAPLAAVITTAANMTGFMQVPVAGSQSFWLESHIALSFFGLAAFATAAAAGTLYLVERHELKSRRLAAVLRVFPPLDTLDRVNRLASIVAWVALSAGVTLAAGYAVNYSMPELPKAIWAVSSWIAVSVAVVSRPILGLSTKRAALLSGVCFLVIIAGYIGMRIFSTRGGLFL